MQAAGFKITKKVGDFQQTFGDDKPPFPSSTTLLGWGLSGEGNLSSGWDE
jgi:hypothetical protein